VDDQAALVCIDAGTTNTRAWLLHGDRVVTRHEAAVGARDTAREGHNRRLRAAVEEMVRALLAVRSADIPRPRLVAAAGMITSPQGLLELPHVTAPAGAGELAAAARLVSLPDLCPLPFLFVPGVRTTSRPGASGIGATDVMRGEETLCVGLLAGGAMRPGASVLNVGSHWKLIGTTAAGQVAWSVTSLSGEMIHAVRTQTVLASALPEGTLAAADHDALVAGAEEARRAGLPRALFGVRLRELAGQGAPAARLSFLTGAFIAEEIDGLRATGALDPAVPVMIAGGEKVGGAWAEMLDGEGYRVGSLTPDDVERGFLAGLRTIVSARGV
jgi:2-dehydro-3-deoxygalactonokinase